MKIKLFVIIIGITLSAIGLLYSCTKHDRYQDLHDYLSKLKIESKHNSKVINFMPVLPMATAYHEQTLRSPFDEIGVVSNQNKSMSNPVQSYPLAMLRFIGTISHDNAIYAYILVPDNRVFQVKVGDMLGDRNGIVGHIDTDRITIKEKQTENQAQSNYKIVTMQLKEKAE